VRKVLEQAQIEAHTLNQEFVGTEHILLALLKAHGCLASRALRAQRIDTDAVRSDLLAIMPYSESPPQTKGTLPLSIKAQRAMNAAHVMSRAQREPKISTSVLMLAMIEQAGASFTAAVRESGGDVEAMLQSLKEKPVEPEM
jgi:ATP-dependent Clp protease ATP-binding subunit ClpC